MQKSAPCGTPDEKKLWPKEKWLAQCREVMFMTPFVVRTKKGMGCSPPTLPPWLLHDNQTNLCIGWPTREGLQANLLILHIFIHGWRVYSVPSFLYSLVSWFPGSLGFLVKPRVLFQPPRKKQFLRRIHLKIYNPSKHLSRIIIWLN